MKAKIYVLITLAILCFISCQEGKDNKKGAEGTAEENNQEVSDNNEYPAVNEKGTADLGPNFNPAKPEIAYYSYVSEDPPIARIFVSNIDGSNARQVSHLDTIGFHVEPKWSRDGRKIVYTSFLDVGSQMIMVNADGQKPTKLATVSDDGFHMFSSWDLTGDGYFFFHWPKEGFTPDAYYYKNGNVERLTNNGKTNRPQLTEDGVLYINRVESENPYVATKLLYDLEKKTIVREIPELEGEFIISNHSVKRIENENSTTFILEDLQGNDLKELGTVPYKNIMFTTIDKSLEHVAYNTDFSDGAEIHLLKISTGELVKVTNN